MQEYRRQIDRESRWSSNASNGSPNGDGIQAIGRSSHKMIEAVMQSAAKGKVCKTFTPSSELLQTQFFSRWILLLKQEANFQVQTIRQGYLSKRSSSLRGDWKRRFFVLDSRGMLYYYRKQCSKPSVSNYVKNKFMYRELEVYSVLDAYCRYIFIVLYMFYRVLAVNFLVKGIALSLDLDC